MPKTFAIGLVLALLVGCGSKGRPTYDENGTANGNGDGNGIAPGLSPTAPGDALTLEPASVVLEVKEGQPLPSVDYHAFLVHKDNSRDDVTSSVNLYLDQPANSDFGTFSKGTFTASPNGVGKTLVHAKLGTLEAGASLAVKLTKVVVLAGAPADAASKFGGAVDPARKPSFVYPDDGVMVPPNMNELEFQYRPGAGNDLFELGVKGDLLDLRVYFACTALGNGCGWVPSPVVWSMLSSAGRGQDPLTYVLRGTSGAGGSVGESTSQTLAFGEEDILGGLYYWNAGAGATMRYEFGVSGQKAETYMNAAKAGALTCVGCHVLSRDGERISVGLDMPAPAAYKVYAVDSKSMVFGQGGAMGGSGANFFSFSPDKSQIMVSNGVTLSLRDATTGAAIQEKVADGAMPDWSPDGNSIVFARPKQAVPCIGLVCASTGVVEASLQVLTKVGSGWSAPTELVPTTGQNNYYPSYSPDGGWILFNRASIGKDADGDVKGSYDAPDASLAVVARTGGTVLPLDKAGSPNGDSWPKWMQRDQNYRGKKLMWLTFSSRRAYGLRKDVGDNAQIWMAAFDPEAAAQGKDPSLPAFWLPFQELSSGNHIAQWVTRVARQGCVDGSVCEGGEACKNGVCVPVIK